MLVLFRFRTATARPVTPGLHLDFKYGNDTIRAMLAVAGGKGGCGKTTTALGLAAALARDGARPVVADADRDSPDLHLLADVPNEPDLTEIDDQPPGTIAHESTEFPDVSILPAPAGSLADGQFQAVFDRLGTCSFPVLVDCPAGASRDAVAPLRTADAVLLATTLDPASLRDAAKTAAMATELDASLAGAVLVRVSEWARATESRDGCDGNIDSLNDELRPIVVRRVERLLDTTVVGGVPAVEADCRGVLDHPAVRSSYKCLARDLSGGEDLF